MHEPDRETPASPPGAPGETRAPRVDAAAGIVVAGQALAAEEPGVLARAAAWAEGRNGWVRLPVLLWFAWIFARHLRDPEYQSLFGGLDLAIHEAGHIVFGPLGDFMGVAGGTILQLAAPLVSGVLFRRQRDWFGIAVAGCWLSINLFDVARYAGDARAQALPLVSPTSGDPIHDWGYMLGRLGMLHDDLAIARGIRALAVLTMLAGLVAGGWLVWRMLRSRPRPEATA